MSDDWMRDLYRREGAALFVDPATGRDVRDGQHNQGGTPAAAAMSRGEQLAAITHRMDAAYLAWRDALYVYDGPEYAALEAVYADLRVWNMGGK